MCWLLRNDTGTRNASDARQYGRHQMHFAYMLDRCLMIAYAPPMLGEYFRPFRAALGSLWHAPVQGGCRLGRIRSVLLRTPEWACNSPSTKGCRPLHTKMILTFGHFDCHRDDTARRSTAASPCRHHQRTVVEGRKPNNSPSSGMNF